MRLIIVCACLFVKYVYGTSNFTFSLEMASRCKEHLCKNGYKYETYYRVDSEDRRKIERDNDLVFELHIAILARSNGHILLSPVARPDSTDPVYEIVVGGGDNKFTELRRNLRRNAKTSAKTVGILSTIDFTAFYIKMSEDGLIEFGKEGDLLPILTYNDNSPLQIRYFSFAAWNGIEAKFLYDCPRPGDKSDTSPTSSKEVDRPVTSFEVLRRTLLQGRQADEAPDPMMNITVGAVVTRVTFDAVNTKLITSVAMITTWTDPTLAWNPDKFNGTKMLRLRLGEIWKPTFFVFNSDVEMGSMDIRNPELITVTSEGEATFRFRTELYTWCMDYSSGFNKWPRDNHECSIIIQPWEVHDKIHISTMSTDDERIKNYITHDEVISNDWSFVSTQFVIPPDQWHKEYRNDNIDTAYLSDRYVLQLEIQRNASMYNITFFTPLYVLLTFVLMSFWSEPLQMSRVWFYAGTSIFICAGICFLDLLIPTHNVPCILVLYVVTLMSVLLALLTQVILMTSIADQVCKTVCMQHLLTSKIVRTLFCLTPMKTCRNYNHINEAYFGQDEDASIVAPGNCSVEEMEVDTNKYGEKDELAEVLDKLMFVIYSGTYAAILAMHY